MTICVTGATGFIGAHVARLASEKLGSVRVTYRDAARLQGLGGTRAERGGRPSALSLAAAGVRLADRAGLLGGLRAAERRLRRRLVAGG